jgi:phage portal protein BeeE
MNNKFKGTKNAHKIAILTNGLKLANNMLSQKDMDFVNMKRFTRDEILAMFKVPPHIV